jgi:hypothetical protein
MRDELFHATAGGGAWLNGERLRVSEVDHLDRGLLATGFPYDIRSAPNNNLGHYAAFAMRTLGVRRLGCASLDLAYVATGRFDGDWEYAVEAWDISAGILLVEEAGGRVTRADGQPNPLVPPTSILATNARLHPAMLAILNGGEDLLAENYGKPAGAGRRVMARRAEVAARSCGSARRQARLSGDHAADTQRGRRSPLPAPRAFAPGSSPAQVDLTVRASAGWGRNTCGARAASPARGYRAWRPKAR